MSKTNQAKAKTRNNRQNASQRRKIGIIIAVVAAVVIFAFLIIPSLLPRQGIDRSQVKDNSMGDPAAPVKVEEFADFQCPACGDFVAKIEPDIVKKYVATGKVYFVFNSFSFLGPESFTAAEAAYCAMDQGKFWDFHDTLFANQAGENKGTFSNTRLNSFASRIGLNFDTYNSCFTSGKYKQKVQDDLTYGKSKSVNATPSFLVNGRLVYSDTLIQTIENEIAAKSK